MCLTFFMGSVIKGLRMSTLTFFLTNSILIHCYYAFFTRTIVTFCWNLCLLYFLPVLCFSYEYCVLLHYFKVMKEFSFLIYLSMQIDSLTWQARMAISNSSKPLVRTKIISREYAVILTPPYCILLIFIFGFHFNNIPESFVCISSI